MRLNVELMNILTYDNGTKCRIGYRLLDRDTKADSARFKGYKELSLFIDSAKPFNEIDSKYLGTACIIELEQTINPNNPTKTSYKLKKVCDNSGKDICVL